MASRFRPAPFHTSLVAAALLLAGALSAGAADTPDPTAVTVAGSLQSELGCADDWQPGCAATHLVYDADDRVWQATFDVPAGSWEYKAPLDDSWDENYGLHAQRNGANIPLGLPTAAAVKFYYSHATHWITDNHNAVIAVAPGSFQSELGCPGDWQPDCLRSWLQDPGGDGIYTFTTSALPAGSYEVKVAIGESWDENYGAGGLPNGPNIPFTVPADCTATTFSYDAVTHVLTVSADGAAPQPASVVVPGSFQSEVGCAGDWQPDCAATGLAFDAADGVWQGSFAIPAGSWEYKATLNGSWDENYGANATPNGANLGLTLADAADVKFYYSHATHWITSNRNAVIAVAPGSFQSELGCPGDWQPDCLRSWLQDPDGDGIYTFATSALPAGSYEVKVAIGESWDENYGAGGAPNGPNIAFTVPAACAETFFVYDAATHVLTVGTTGAPAGNLGRAQAYWLAEDLIAWNPAGAEQPDWSFALHHDPSGGLALATDGVQGGNAIPLTLDPAGLPADATAKFPHLAGLLALRLPPAELPGVPAALRDQLAVSAVGGDGTLLDATSLQIQGVLDDLFAYDGPLGLSLDGGTPELRLWAPTARSVRLHLFDASSGPATAVLDLDLDAATGVWSIAGSPSWLGKYYLFAVEVWVRSTGAVETNLVTDPYSLSLSRNSTRSQLVDLDDPALAPPGWDELAKPPLAAPEDVSIYELHIRDFSAGEPSVPAELRGTYGAFGLLDSGGMRHLAALAAAGLTHVHLLPAFDISSVDEDKSTWLEPEGDLGSLPPDSAEQQARVMAVAGRDGFNWGYDPWHYTVPEGSYASEPDGPARIGEFRGMVQGLAGAGLRVVMDVVYNHTTASGQNSNSVLDRIVPGYYHRLDADGNVETSTCCQNTASEFAMMEKLLVDSVVTWARAYKVDGFRFDIMGHHSRANLLAVRQALDALTPAADGVDGRAIYVYGEGWNFGEVANDARFVQATQRNMAGTGIGSFNDRLRDGARGGGPFSGLQEQGFLSGLWYDPNATDQGSPDDQLARLLQRSDWIRVGLAGGLADYSFVDRFGNLVAARDIDYNGQPAGYTADPQELINYVEAHDNETLFDAIQLKAPAGTVMDDRVRMQNLGMSLLALGQGVPFFHAGVDLLRSKSLDRNSYDSGDWFNQLDFTYQDNNWGVGLPPARDNQSSWPVQAPLLADPALDPGAAEIDAAREHFREALAIRKSSPLFRLRSAAEITARLRFHNTGPDQLPGLIVMSLTDTTGAVDRRTRRIVTLLNARDVDQELAVPSFPPSPCTGFTLHPLQADSADPVVRQASVDTATCTFSVPARTAAVFVQGRPVADQLALLARDIDALVASHQLNRGQGVALRAKLQLAAHFLAAGHEALARAALELFIHQVRVFVKVRILTADQGDALIAEAEAIQGAIAG